MSRGDTLYQTRRVTLARHALGLLALLGASATAGTLYRCESSDGVAAYSSQRTPGATCKAIHYTGGGGSKRSPVAFSPSSGAPAGAPLAPDLPASAMLSTARPLQVATITAPASQAPTVGAGGKSRVEFRT
ncbi:MAG: hypothetical protein ABIQ97_00420, partial [Lysobacteraceae bacterium]